MTDNMTKRKNALAIFSFLSKGHSTKEEIMEKLNIGSSGFAKNITLLKKAGFLSTTSKGVYRFDNLRTTFKLLNYEKSILAYAITLASIMLPIKTQKMFKSAVKKIYSLAGEKDYDKLIAKSKFYKLAFLSYDYEDKIEEFENYTAMKQKLEITLLNGTKLHIEPVNTRWKNEKFVLYYTDIINDTNSEITLDKIVKASPIERKEEYSKRNEVIYEIYGKLMKSYLLKNEERIIDHFRDRIVIANNSKDKKTLFKRLLRYDVLCKVLYPKKDAQEFAQLVEHSIANIER